MKDHFVLNLVKEFTSCKTIDLLRQKTLTIYVYCRYSFFEFGCMLNEIIS
jgi:hypothetical protein